jgi:murein DD-endopeptidase MepM/ murein hydrolase activator NlpD
MPPHFERTALILLAGTALTACASPRYPVTAPLVQLPPPSVAPAPAVPPQTQMAAIEPPAAVVRSAPVEQTQLAPLVPARPAAPPPAEVARATSPAPNLAYAPPAVDTAARSRSRRGPAATYTVQRGDTLARIADKLGTDVQALAKANGLKSPYRINPGDVLKNPKAPAASASRNSRRQSGEPATGGRTYTVQAGDTLFGIALKFGTTVDTLREANGISGSGLMRGRTLKIPGDVADAPAETDEPDTPPPAARASSRAPDPAPEPDEPSSDSRTVTTRQVTGRVIDIQVPGTAYKVKSGDNLERIARRLDSDVEELAKLNKLKKPYRLQPGQTIRGPGSSTKGYVTVRGDTLALVARRFDVTVDELRNANGLRRGASLSAGRRLKLPAGYRDRGPIVTRSEAPAAAPPRTPAPSRPSSFDTPPPPGQRLPPPVSAPRPPQVEDTTRLPSRPQPYRPSGPVAGAPVASPPVSDAQIMEMGRGRFAWPIRGELISSYGARGVGQRNDGINIRTSAGEPVRASAAGDVVYAGDQVPGFGNLVLIKHADGWVTAYGHLGRVNVRMQQKVEQGQEIGQAGSSGGVSEPQLHFEVRYAPTPQERARPIDPALVLPR